jgi:hypothetical protein
LFERQHHRRVAAVLQALDADLLASNLCWFGGGTAIALRHGEYRESVDVDFMVSDLDGYRALRQRVGGTRGVQALARAGASLDAVRPVRADQYGVRAMLRVDDVDIKLEIILEARVTLEIPAPEDNVCGVATLTPLDMATTKLLANSDRWRDDAVHSRDLIDLAMMAPPRALLQDAIEKAQAAYGDSVEKDLAGAIEDLRSRPHRLDRCMHAMHITMPKALLWKRIRALAP